MNATNTGKINDTNDEEFFFEQQYIAVRKKEKRLYTDDEVKQLPSVSKNHLHYKEWLIRKRSAEKLVQYLSAKKRKLSILEIGCGNGWLSNKLADIPRSIVTGIDINSAELKQGAKIFIRSNLTYIHHDIEKEILTHNTFDIIVFAASIQYFFSFKNIVDIASTCLNTDGEIHIIDSPFYHSGEIQKAKQRTENYYSKLGHTQMAAYYFHHHSEELENYRYKKLYDPLSVKNKFFSNPFPWICIKK